MGYILSRTHIHIVQTGSCTHAIMARQCELDPDLKAAIEASMKDQRLLESYDRSLEHRLKSQGLRRVPVPGDGNCLFTAWGKSVQADPRHLRNDAVDYLRHHEDLFKSLNGDEESVRDYCSRMIKDKVFGDLIMIRALSEISKRPVIIVSPYGDIQHFGLDKFSLCDTVTLAYNGVNHYDAVVPSQADADSTLNDAAIAAALDEHERAREFAQALRYDDHSISRDWVNLVQDGGLIRCISTET